MGFFARFICLRREGSVHDLTSEVRALLGTRNFIETADPAAADRLLVIAPAGNGWLMVLDHVEDPGSAMTDADGLLAELRCTAAQVALDIIVTDSDELGFLMYEGGELQAQLLLDRRGFEGPLEPWQRLLLPGQSVEDIPKAFANPTTFIEQHFPVLKPLFGIDLAAFEEIWRYQSGKPPRDDAVLLSLRAVAAPGHVIGPPKLMVDERQRQNFLVNMSFPQIPLGLVTSFPAFTFLSRGGGARGFEVALTGSALAAGLIEIDLAILQRQHPTDSKLNQVIKVAPEITSAGMVLRFPEVEVPDWVQPNLGAAMRAHASLQDLRVFVYARGIKVGDGELEAEAHLVEPESATVRTSYPVTVLPAMWRPLKGNERPQMIHCVRAMNDPTRINALAVLRGEANETVSALRRTLETWQSLANKSGVFNVAAATEPIEEYAFFSPCDLSGSFRLDLSKKRNAKWDRVMANLPSLQCLRIASDLGISRDEAPTDDGPRFESRISLQYVSPAPHPRLPAYAARLGHVSLSLPAGRAGQDALITLMQTLATERLLGQAYVAVWNHEDEPKGTLYESASDIFVHPRVTHGWGTRYLRAVADRMWLGPEFAAMLPDRAALEQVAVVTSFSDTLDIDRRPEATLRDLELCLEPMLASKAESEAFWELFAPRRRQQS